MLVHVVGRLKVVLAATEIVVVLETALVDLVDRALSGRNVDLEEAIPVGNVVVARERLERVLVDGQAFLQLADLDERVREVAVLGKLYPQ